MLADFDQVSAVLDISPPARDHARRFARVQTYPDNSVVYYQDDPTGMLYFVVRGYVRLSYISEDGLVTLHSIVPPGRSFGEAGALERFGYCDTAFTVGMTHVLVLDLACMSEGGPLADEIRLAIARLIARRYRDHVEFTRALYRPNLALRLSYSLLRLLDLMGNDIRYQGRMVQCLGPVVTQRDLGSMARGTRENVNKTLRQWQKQAILALEDRHIIVLDRERLEQVSLEPE